MTEHRYTQYGFNGSYFDKKEEAVALPTESKTVHELVQEGRYQEAIDKHKRMHARLGDPEE